MSIVGNMAGCYSPIGKTFVITDENGNELTGVVTENVVVFDADPKTDIREGKVAATSDGIVTGSAFIPNYNTYQGCKVIPKGSSFILGNKESYDYTELQAIICSFNTSLQDSVSAEQVAIENQVFSVQSTEAISDIVKDPDNTVINFGITNTSDKIYLIRYFLYKEMY